MYHDCLRQGGIGAYIKKQTNWSDISSQKVEDSSAVAMEDIAVIVWFTK